MPYKDKAKAREARQRYRDRNRKFVEEYLSDKFCVKCDFSDSRALDFDHVDKTGKVRSISDMVAGTASIKAIINEIKKCQVLCSNCHRIKTAENKDYLHEKNKWREGSNGSD